ncbi:MAG TPA: hypothetical protein VJP88_00490, partial [Caulobacteraceae bacterium]|nr:hypothetical protein [Caulobacteraceae bacterium]
MDSYQAIYDATRSRISGGNVGDAVDRAAREAFDFSHQKALITEAFVSAAHEMERPSVLYRPTIAANGDQWMVLLGENMQVGVVGFGETPAKAMAAFDQAF